MRYAGPSSQNDLEHADRQYLFRGPLNRPLHGFVLGTAATSVEALLLPNWGDDDWKQLFRFTSTRRVPAGDALIRRGEPDRTLYFVLHGELEVIAHSGDGLSLGRDGCG